MRRSVWSCALLWSAVICPTPYRAAARADGKDQQPGPAKSRLAGTIYVSALLQAEGNGPSKGERVNGIIAVDPNTGAWRKVAGDGVRGRVSPDGKLLAFVTERQTWVTPATGRGEPRRVCELGVAPVWSPDGKQLIVHKGELTEGKGWRLENYRVNADGSGRTKLPVPSTDEVDDWSADGEWVATASDRHPPHGYGYQIYVMHPDGTRPRRLTREGLNCYPRFAPDGKRIVFFHSGREGTSLRTVGVDGKQERVLVGDEKGTEADSACWSPDGKHLVAVCFDYDKQGGGRGRPEDPDKARYRLVIVGADGEGPREIPLRRARFLDLRHCPDWK